MLNKTKFFILSSLYIFSLSSVAKQLTGFCFPSNTSLTQVKAHLSPILAIKDRVYLRESVNCLELEISPVKTTLFRNWIKKRFKITDEYNVAGGGQMETTISQQTSLNHCRMEVIRVLKSNEKIREISLKKRGTLRQTEGQGSGETRSSLMLLSGKAGSIQVDNYRVNLTCHYKSSSRYVLEINILGADSSLMTTVSITEGQKLNIGDIVEKINQKSQTINSKGLGLNYKKSSGNRTYTYYITIK